MSLETSFNPEEHAEVPGGFVTKEALATEVEDRRTLELLGLFKGKGTETTREDVINLLQTQASNEDESRNQEMVAGEEMLAQLRQEKIDKYDFWENLSPRLKESKKFMLQALAVDGMWLQELNSELRSDPEVVLEAVKQHGGAIDFAEGEVRKDRAIALEAVTNNGFALNSLDEELKADKEIVLAAVRAQGSAIEYASSDLKKDREVVLAAVKDCPYLLDMGRELRDFRNDKEVALAAVSADGEALRYVDTELTDDFDVVSAAMKNNPKAVRWVGFQTRRRIQEAAGITDEEIQAERQRQSDAYWRKAA